MAKPRIEVIQEPATRFVAEWTPRSVRAAITAMATGRFIQAGSLADALLGDDRVPATIGTRVNGVTGLPLTFKPADETDRANTIAEALATDWWSMLPEQALADMHTYGLLCGVVAAQLNWQEQNGRIVPQIEVWHPSLLSRNKEGQWLVTLDGGVEHVITPGDGQWLLYTPYGRRRSWSRALLRALAVPWLSKQYAYRDWNHYSEVLGGTVRQGTIPASTKPEDREAFKRDLRELGNNGVVVMPEGYGLSLVEASGRSADNFDKLIDRADKAITIAVLGQNLTTDVEGGSHAAATVHDNVRQDLVESDVQSLSTHLHEQVLTWWAEFNFGDRTLAPWPEWLTAPIPPAGEIYQYHLMAPVVTKNELRGRLNLPPVPPEQGGEEFVTITPEQPMGTGLLSTAGTAGVKLASGDDPQAAPGFVRGQLYADAVGDAGAQAATPALQPFVQRIADAIASASDYDSLRAEITGIFEGSNPQELMELTEKALVLADLAGRLAEKEDSD